MYTLLTGATGLVGRYLVRDLLLNGHQLAVVVRPSRKADPRERMEQILQHWEEELGRSLPRPIVLSGDIAEPGFGLSDADREWVGSNVNCIMHSAAILEFYGEDRAGEPWRTNLGGTRHMIALCRELKIHDIHYVSTAYVAGIQDGRAMEDALDVGQTFRNDYEESKFLAEQEVRAIDFADHVTIYRPAVISGDSVTGYTNTYHGLYLYLRLMAVMIPSQPVDENGMRHTPVRLAMDGNESRNIIPVDWVSAVMVRIFESQEARGGTYTMAPDKPMTSGDMIRWSAEYFKSEGAQLCGRDFVAEEVSRDENEDQWMFERLVKENMGTYEPYERTDNVFDMTNMKRFAGDIVCPEIDRTVIHRYIEFGEEDRWGKRRPAAAKVRNWVSNEVAELAAKATDATSSHLIGLDVQGPCGAQLTVGFNQHGVTSATPGLPASSETPVVRMQVEDWAQLRENPTQMVERLLASVESADGSNATSLINLFVQALSNDAMLTSAT
ncbi:MAG: SDR family oxidoreductase [Fuerstiella sp.]